MNPLRRVLPLVLTLAGAYLLVCLGVFALQRRLVYFPGPPPTSTPASLGLAFDDLHLTTADGETIHGWRIKASPGESNAGRLVLHCHGNGGNIAGRLAVAWALAGMGFDTLLFDYRGYGASKGTPSEEGTYLDACAAYDWAVGEGGYAPERIAVFGESLGGAVGVELALRRPVAGLVLESAFTSLPDVGARVYPWLPVRLLSRFRYDSLAKIGKVHVPILSLHSRGDELVAYELGERLARAANAELVELPGGHDSGGFLQRGDLQQAVRAFLERAFASPALRSDAPAQ